ncbi:hypothetical protein GO988_08850 [Hymenobacter sp. HMF4947]|uniref:DUF2158 domain-containing protein n=1 Tax=Hymenobacter ginkgonis TaxID=2682976 RepID=A0A7K1TE45_9BACT|nr:hypothetical protein [Hymenobacter ginkgonis]MVN76431.1 hypothetical protein [Hymenobacter ginkgonis]
MKPGDYVVHKTGGPVYIITGQTGFNSDYWECERWNGNRHESMTFAEIALRLATEKEVSDMQADK